LSPPASPEEGLARCRHSRTTLVATRGGSPRRLPRPGKCRRWITPCHRRGRRSCLMSWRSCPAKDQGGKGSDATFSEVGRGGNSAAYLVAKLKRDAPDYAERLAAGEFRSAARVPWQQVSSRRRRRGRSRAEPGRACRQRIAGPSSGRSRGTSPISLPVPRGGSDASGASTLTKAERGGNPLGSSWDASECSHAPIPGGAGPSIRQERRWGRPPPPCASGTNHQ
jgi:hypothetical protein